MSGSAFDKDLREGEAREDAFVHVLLRSRVEHKRDKRCTEWKNHQGPTGNLCVEFQQSDGCGGHKPSGIAVSEAHSWAFEYRAEHWLIVPRERVYELARRAHEKGLTRRTGDNGNVSALVPIAWFFENQAAPIALKDAA
jgi:hypothetical protein